MDTNTASQNFVLWKDAIHAGEPENVSELYLEECTLLPTMGTQVISNREDLVSYFTNFCALQPHASILEEHVIPISDTRYLHCGIYRFALIKEEKQDVVDARFSMLWQQEDTGWRILHHHSSTMPEV